jgi:riboflavin synthase
MPATRTRGTPSEPVELLGLRRRSAVFTGIVEDLGEIVAVEELTDARRIVIRSAIVTPDAREGDSIAVNGVCLTVTGTTDDTFSADVMLETMERSSLAKAQRDDRVNLERSVTLQDRLGGHLVQGHVDATGTIEERTPAEHWEVVRISLPDSISRYVVEKGSIAVDGTSLTVSQVSDDSFEVSLIPETLKRTTLGFKRAGDMVNLEVDIIGKYVERLLGSKETK